MMNRRRFALASAGVVGLGMIGLPALAERRQAKATVLPPPDINWLRQYAGMDVETLRSDPRLRSSLRWLFPKALCPFLGCRVRMSRILPALVSLSDAIRFEHDRFLVITGTRRRLPGLRTLIWIDMQPAADGHRRPLAIAASLVPQPSGKRGRHANVWITSNRELRHVRIVTLHRHFNVSLRRWLRQGTPSKEGRIAKVNWLAPSMHIRPAPPTLVHVPASRLGGRA